jgi:hypothetical protein
MTCLCADIPKTIHQSTFHRAHHPGVWSSGWLQRPRHLSEELGIAEKDGMSQSAKSSAPTQRVPLGNVFARRIRGRSLAGRRMAAIYSVLTAETVADNLRSGQTTESPLTASCRERSFLRWTGISSHSLAQSMAQVGETDWASLTCFIQRAAA